MPTFYFHARQNGQCDRDEAGQNVASEEEALKEAKRALADMARDALKNQSHGSLAIDVVKESGELLVTASIIFSVVIAESATA